MDSNIIRSWNGKTIRHRADGYFSLTDMAQSTGKQVASWLRNKDTTEYLEMLSIDTGFSIRNDEIETESHYVNSHNALIDIQVGGKAETTGTWGHELVAIEFARWCDKNLSIQCNKWIKELLSAGSVSIVSPATTVTPVPITTVSLPYVPTTAEQLKMVVDSLSLLGCDFENPRFQQGYQDWAHNLLGIKTSSTTALPSGSLAANEEWMGVCERAEELGFGCIGANHSERVKLGNYVSKFEDDVIRKREKRLCNGQSRPIWVYKVTERFDEIIRDYFDYSSKRD